MPTIQRWVFKFTLMIDTNLRRRKRGVGLRWCLDETYINVNGVICIVRFTKKGKRLIFY